MPQRLLIFSAALGLCLLGACSNDHGDNDDSAGAAGKQPVHTAGTDGGGSAGDAANPDDNGAGQGAGGVGTPAADPVYVVSTGVIVGEDFVGYLVPVHSLEGGGTFGLEDAVELSAGAFIFSRPGDVSIYVASGADPTITRWEVTRDAKFIEHETLSFANLGIFSASASAFAPIFSEKKSYFADDEQDRIVIWNPEKMEFIDTIELGDEDMGTLLPIPEGAMLVRDDKLVVTIGWRDPDDTTLLGDHVRVVTIDTKTDEIIDSKLEDRNVHAALSTIASDGTAYFGPYSLYNAYTEIGAGHGAPSPIFRINPGETSFDPDFSLDLSSLVGGRPAGDYTLLDDETALIRAWHPEIVDKVDPENWKDVLWNEAGFMWWRWHIGDAQAVEIEDQVPGAQAGTIFKVDGKTYTIRYADDLSSTALVEITPKGEFVTAITAPGAIIGSGVIRVH